MLCVILLVDYVYEGDDHRAAFSTVTTEYWKLLETLYKSLHILSIPK